MRRSFIVLLIVISVLATPLASAALNDAYAYISMDTDNWTDVSGNGRNGVASDPSWSDSTYKLVASGVFDGVDDHIYLADSDIPPRDVSVSAWVRFDTLNKDQFIVSKGSGSTYSNSEWGLHTCAGGAAVCCYRGRSGGGAPEAIVWYYGSNIVSGSWHHFACTMDYDQNEMILYVDGIQRGNSTAIFSEADTADQIYIGMRKDGWAPLDGFIDEVGVWNRTLTPAEITSLYNGGTGYNPYSAAPVAGNNDITFTIFDLYDNAPINSGARITINNGSVYVAKTNATGNTFVFKDVAPGVSYNFEVDNSPLYFDYIGPFTVQNGSTTAINLSGAFPSFNFTNIIGDYLNNFTISSGSFSNSSGEVGVGDLLNRRILLKPNSTNIINISKVGYVPITINFSTAAKDLTYNTINDLYQSLLTVNLTLGKNGSIVNGFTMNISGLNDLSGHNWSNTTAGNNVSFPLMFGNYSYVVVPNEYSIASGGFGIPEHNLTYNITIVVYQNNSFYLSIYDEITQKLLSGVNITVSLISDDYAVNVTTDNGSYAFELLTPAEYTIRYGGGEYSDRDYYQLLRNQEHHDFSIYSIHDDYKTYMVVTVLDTLGSPVVGAVVQLRRYYVNSNSYEVVEMARTAYNGQAYMKAQAYDGYYKLAVVYAGRTLLTSSYEKFFPGPGGVIERTITFDTGTDYYSSFQALPNVARSLTYNNETHTYSFSWSDPSGLVYRGCFYADYPNGTKWDRLSNCQDSSDGNVLLTLPNAGSKTYKYSAMLYTSTNYSDYTVFSGFNDAKRTFFAGAPGAFLGVAIIGTLAIGGAMLGAVVGLVAAIIGIIFTAVTSLLPWSWATISGIIALSAGVTIYLMRK